MNDLDLMSSVKELVAKKESFERWQERKAAIRDECVAIANVIDTLSDRLDNLASMIDDQPVIPKMRNGKGSALFEQAFALIKEGNGITGSHLKNYLSIRNNSDMINLTTKLRNHPQIQTEKQGHNNIYYYRENKLISVADKRTKITEVITHAD